DRRGEVAGLVEGGDDDAQPHRLPLRPPVPVARRCRPPNTRLSRAWKSASGPSRSVLVAPLGPEPHVAALAQAVGVRAADRPPLGLDLHVGGRRGGDVALLAVQRAAVEGHRHALQPTRAAPRGKQACAGNFLAPPAAGGARKFQLPAAGRCASVPKATCGKSGAPGLALASGRHFPYRESTWVLWTGPRP